MNTVKNRLWQIRQRILSEASQVAHYDSWSDEFSRKQIKEACSCDASTFMRSIERFHINDFHELTIDEMWDAGFANWDDELVLIPLWLKNFIYDHEMVVSISGDTCTLAEADNDCRGGMMAYGFYKDAVLKLIGDAVLKSIGDATNENQG